MTTGPTYADLTDEEQAEALRPVAVAAAASFGLPVDRLDVHLHSYNTTYALDTDTGERFALRINTSSTSPREEIATQQAWQLAIAQQTPVRVPTPLRTTDGQWCAAVQSQVLGRELLVTCADWLPGPDVGEPTPQVAHALGAAMAHLHLQARSWSLPVDGILPVFDSPLFGAPDRLATTAVDAPTRQVLDEAMALATTAFARVYADAPVHALHADLHGGNLKWHQDRLAIFDFDDCGLGVPALDLAIATFYLRGGADDAEQAMRDGYASVTPLPEIDPRDFEPLIAARQLLLLNDIVASTTAQFREMAATYLPTSTDRLRHWLTTGHFTRVLPDD
ncbi:phosphotransferase [Ornithinimicrobium ciconiae]|uniref:Phosphotransferase n=1 Tax=Ornithinimicrobium ciconiae TaxID=2594265 RepID=A0A516G652_9MICO|nr:phosphotransferase [Ornithinimicrobium ciconiae]QDO87011.1 phosphotransferase [Ornithinimicrobium ciconiae]